jgi:phospholipase/carboxylesterase
MKLKTILFEQNGWTLRARLPEGEGPHPVLLLLHGLTGDENVMWVFANRLPGHYLMLALRAPHAYAGGGFSWYPDRRQGWPSLDDLRPSIENLVVLLDSLADNMPAEKLQGEEQQQVQAALANADFSRLSLVGFSQGAALSYAFGMLHPERVDMLAGMAGFMPEQVEELAQMQPLEGKRVFVTHGTQDQTVPIERARRSVEILHEAGADVTFCEENVGHKLSVVCFRSLGDFFANQALSDGGVS